MDLETLRGIAELMEEHGLTRLKLDEKDLKLDIAREVPAPAPLPVASLPGWPVGWDPDMTMAPSSPAPVPAPAAAPQAPAVPEAAPEPCGLSTADGQPVDSARVSEVCAPMVGVFYAAPAPGAEPFVRVGSRVKKGDTLCILEAMKLMNEVVAERDGEVVEACVEDGELVEYGRVLFRIY